MRRKILVPLDATSASAPVLAAVVEARAADLVLVRAISIPATWA